MQKPCMECELFNKLSPNWITTPLPEALSFISCVPLVVRIHVFLLTRIAINYPLIIPYNSCFSFDTFLTSRVPFPSPYRGRWRRSLRQGKCDLP